MNLMNVLANETLELTRFQTEITHEALSIVIDPIKYLWKPHVLALLVYLNVFVDHLRSAREGNVFRHVFPSVHGAGARGTMTRSGLVWNGKHGVGIGS